MFLVLYHTCLPYRVSVSYTNENGMLKTSNMERLTGAIA